MFLGGDILVVVFLIRFNLLFSIIKFNIDNMSIICRAGQQRNRTHKANIIWLIIDRVQTTFIKQTSQIFYTIHI